MKKSDKTKNMDGRGPGADVMARTYFVFTLFTLFAVAVIAKVVYIQLFEGEDLKARAIRQEYRYFDTDAVRGNIYASDGSLLATSIPVYELRMDLDTSVVKRKLFNDSVTWLARSLSKKFGDKTQWEYKQMLIKARKDRNRYLLIHKEVTAQQLQEIKKFPIFNRGQYRGGLIVIRKTRREYPYGMLARRTIGYSRPQANVFIGLEGAYNDVLKGTKGRHLYRRMANGAWKPVPSQNNIDPVNGKDIITTIDPYLQDVAESTLMRHLMKQKAEKGTVILMEVKTGEIKAIANLQKDKHDGRYKEQYNIAIGELFEPGSTFKLPSMMVALENGWIDKTDSVPIGDGWTQYHNRTMKDSHLIDADGWLTPYEAFIYSSNVAVSRIIYDNAQEDPWSFVEPLRKMFYFNELNIDIRGDKAPKMHTPDSRYWSKVSLPWMSIGYELTVTPLHLLTFYNAVANNGKMMKPVFVKEIRDADRIIMKQNPEVLINKICSDKTINTAHKYLEGVVEKGTARNISNAVYKIAGKTGTGKINENGRYIPKYNASFAGYFPADSPKYSCIVLIHKPDGGSFYATKVAAPVFKEIADVVYATQLDIHPDGQDNIVTRDAIAAGEKEKLSDEEWLKRFGIEKYVDASGTDLKTFLSNKTVPDVTGYGVTDAVFILENLGLKTKITGKGRVKSQSVRAGTPVRTGDVVQLTLEI